MPLSQQMSGATYPGKLYQSFGGVGYNIANCMSRLGSKPLFVSAIGNDIHASSLLSYSTHMVNAGHITHFGIIQIFSSFCMCTLPMKFNIYKQATYPVTSFEDICAPA